MVAQMHKWLDVIGSIHLLLPLYGNIHVGNEQQYIASVDESYEVDI